MSANQTKLLLDLAKKIKSEPKNREQVLTSLRTAKILTKKGKFTKHYSNLQRVFPQPVE